jgi:hypothetical protein
MAVTSLRSRSAKTARVSVRPDNAQQTAQPIQCLNHLSQEACIPAVAGKNLADCYFEPANQLVGLLAFLIGHVALPLLLFA